MQLKENGQTTGIQMIHNGDKELSPEWVKILKEKGIIQKFQEEDPYHVIYEGGKIHSDVSFNINKILADQSLLNAVLEALFREWCKHYNELPDAICSHTPYGRPLAELLGALLKKPVYIYISETSLWEGGEPPFNSRCIIVGDDVLTGGRLTCLTKAIEEVSAAVMEPALVLADLSTY